MKSRYTDFSNGVDIENVIFNLLEMPSGLYYLSTIYDAMNIKEKKGWFFTYNDIVSMNGFYIPNKKGTGSKFKTSKGFINRIKKDRYERT